MLIRIDKGSPRVTTDHTETGAGFRFARVFGWADTDEFKAQEAAAHALVSAFWDTVSTSQIRFNRDAFIICAVIECQTFFPLLMSRGNISSVVSHPDERSHKRRPLFPYDISVRHNGVFLAGFVTTCNINDLQTKKNHLKHTQISLKVAHLYETCRISPTVSKRCIL